MVVAVLSRTVKTDSATENFAQVVTAEFQVQFAGLTAVGYHGVSKKITPTNPNAKSLRTIKS
jgi:hypothetical protein